jgi:eukaryotic-like serine/threonine-protein kinase
MNSESWEEVEAIFASVAELGPAERAALLEARCSGRPDLRAEVESLLASHDDAGRFLETASTGSDRDGAPSSGDLSGRMIGRFRLLERVAEGGMGVVYRAERAEDEFREHVAVKLLAVPVHSADALRRFRTERQILATLNHPDIVTLLDGGVADDGQAYLAMKYVEGVPITEYCVERRLGLSDRVRLFQRVCAAVQHAHLHAIVHRDLKPANILVTADGMPKVLDFGVAKLLDATGSAVDATGTSLLRPMTPNYASPEQLRGLPVTTACDIYALGVLLYELMAGVRPYETAGKPLDELLETVVDREPPRPSAAAARARRIAPHEARRLRGDLDAIVLKALSKDPAQRYGSAQELSEDLSRHLAGQPVLARAPSWLYVAGALARRHRAAFVAGAASVAALVAALGVSLWQMQIAVTERDRATARFNDTRQLANALIFTIHDQVRPLAGSTPVRQSIVVEALQYLERLSADPAADDELRVELAKAYRRIGEIQGNPSTANLGDRTGAVASLHKAIELLRPVAVRQALWDAELELGRAQLSLATVVADSSNDEALAAARAAETLAEALVRRRAGDADARRLLASAHFQLAQRVEAPERLSHWQRADGVFQELLAEQPHDPDRQRNVALVNKYLGSYYERVGDYSQGLRHHQRAQEIDEQRLAAAPADRERQLDLAIDWMNISLARWRMGDLAQAAAGYERSHEIFSLLATSDPEDVRSTYWLARVSSRLGEISSQRGHHATAREYALAAVQLSERISTRSSAFRARHAEALGARALVEEAAGQRPAACAAHAQAVEILGELVEQRSDADRIEGIRRVTDRLDAHTACAASGLPIR